MPRLAPLALCFALLACGDDDPTCPGGDDPVMGRCLPQDAGGDDAAMDAGSDAGPCGVCADGTVCDSASGTCVQCLTSDHCADDTPVCDTEAHNCVQCLTHDDCTDPAAAQCSSSGTCTPCADHAHCAGTSLDLCSDGHCVQCDAASEETACDGKACDLASGSCSSQPLRSARECEPCVSDGQCQDGMRCVPLSYKGEPHGNFCLQTRPPACPKPFTIPLTDRTSLGGVTGDYCGINEDLTTCEAVRALLDDQICDSDGPDGPDGGGAMPCPLGGLCRDLGIADGNRCTYPCSGSQQCQVAPNPGSTCGGGSSTEPDYCGGGR